MLKGTSAVIFGTHDAIKLGDDDTSSGAQQWNLKLLLPLFRKKSEECRPDCSLKNREFELYWFLQLKKNGSRKQ